MGDISAYVPRALPFPYNSDRFPAVFQLQNLNLQKLSRQIPCNFIEVRAEPLRLRYNRKHFSQGLNSDFVSHNALDVFAGGDEH